MMKVSKPLLALLFITAIVVIAIGLVVVAPLDAVDDQTVSNLSIDLAAKQPDKLAWAAYRIGQHGTAEAIPALVDILRQDLSGLSQRTELDLKTHVLDALIALRAQLSQEDMQLVFDQGLSTPSLIICQQQRLQPDLKPVLDMVANDVNHLTTEEWVFACNLLLRWPHQDIATAFAEPLAVHLTIELDTEPELGAFMNIGSSGGTAHGRIVRSEHWPPRPFYSLSLNNDQPVSGMMSGPQSVTWSREEYHAAETGVGMQISNFDKQAYRLACLVHLLGIEDGPKTTTPVCSIEWRNVEGFKKDVEAQLHELRRQWEPLRVRLAEWGFSSPVSWPQLTVTVTDFRREKAPPLPDTTSLMKQTFSSIPLLLESPNTN